MLLLFLFHAIIFASCYTFAWMVRFDFEIPDMYVPVLKGSFPFVVGIQLAAGAIFGFYRGWWRYVGIRDATRIGAGLTIAFALLVGGWYAGPLFDLDPRYYKTPRGVLLINWTFALLSLFGARVAIRLGWHRIRPEMPPGAARRVIIVGAGDAGEALAREIEHRPELEMKIVAFVDDHTAKWNSHIRGINVTGPISAIPRIAEALGAQDALLAIPSASGKRIREIIEHLSAANLTFKTMPGMDQIVSGRVQVSQLRPVNVEDLLRRKRIDLPGDPLHELFTGKRVLITGAGGTIGAELASQIAGLGVESISLIERSEFALYEVSRRLAREATSPRPQIGCHLVNICDTAIMEDLIGRVRPHIVLHAAAHKHVTLGEENPSEYLRNNTLATRDLAGICSRMGVERFVFVSTDKAINPSSVMGATKRAAEILLLDQAPGSPMAVTIVRFGNVIGSSGSAIPLFIEQIAAGGPVTVTHPDVTRYFIRNSEAISLVLQAATLGAGGQIFMLDMGEPVKIADLARDLIRLSNHSEDEIPIVFTGLRPGEKLFEEIRLSGESVHPTAHPQIVVTAAPQPDRERVHRWLSDYSHTCDADSAHAALKALVPDFRKSPDANAPARQDSDDSRVARPFDPATAIPQIQ